MTDKTIFFPIQKEDPNDDHLTDFEAVFQLKLKATAMLNKAAAETYTINTKI